MNDKMIEVFNLSKFYGNFQALDNISFDVYKGDVFGFLGPNGAGKSTSIRCMLSLIQPSSGSIKIFGKNLATERNKILQNIGSIIEKPDFYKYLSAKKNLEIFGRLSGADTSKSKVYEMLEYVGLKGREMDKVGGFSHGMKQRLGIAQTLLHNPELIILDEPTTGLDPQGIIDIRNLILRLKNEQNKTVVLSSHILSEIELIANRMIIIDKGKLIVQGSVSDLLNKQELIVTIEVSDTENAKSLLVSQFANLNFGVINQERLCVNASKEEVAEIINLLVKRGFKIYSIESKRKLEDYFLKAIQNDVIK
jgi:ABC-type multidrug transport system ATPase subunit